MNVETTPELILAAAEKCPQAKEALKTLFPKVFEDDLKHPYRYGFKMIKVDTEVYFELANSNTDITEIVINYCMKETKKRKGQLWTMVKDNKSYLGFPL